MQIYNLLIAPAFPVPRPLLAFFPTYPGLMPFYSHEKLHIAFQQTSGSPQLCSLHVSIHAEEHWKKKKPCNHAKFFPFTLKDLCLPTKI